MVPAVIVTDAVGTYLTNLGQPHDPLLAEMEAHGPLVLAEVRT